MLFSLLSITGYANENIDYKKIYLQYAQDNNKELIAPANGAMLLDLNGDAIPEMFSVTKFDKYYDENGELLTLFDGEEGAYSFKDTHYEIRNFFSIIDGKVVKAENGDNTTIVMPGLPRYFTQEHANYFTTFFVTYDGKKYIEMQGDSFGSVIYTAITYDEAEGFTYTHSESEATEYLDYWTDTPCAYVDFTEKAFRGEITRYKAIEHLLNMYAEAVENSFKCSEWAKEDIKEAEKAGLIPGAMRYDDLTSEITREEFAAIAMEYLYAAETEINWHGGALADIDGCLYEDYISGAYVLGITDGTGYDENNGVLFSPYLNITREQMATMLYRALEVYADRSGNTDKWLKNSSDSNYLFADYNIISDYAKDPVCFMQNKSIIGGTGENCFSPQATATKEQAIIIALRMHKAFKE